MKIKASQGCCAIYELYDLDFLVQKPKHGTFANGYTDMSPEPKTGTKEQWDRAITGVLHTARARGVRHLPRVIFFSDADATWSGKSNGEHWYDHLRSRKHKVTKKSLGLNPKSGNTVTMYHWYPEGV